jgi:hypothetical protein
MCLAGRDRAQEASRGKNEGGLRRPRPRVAEQDVLLATKLHVPRAQPGFVPRARLVEALDEGLARGLVWSAPRPGPARRPCWPTGPGPASGR